MHKLILIGGGGHCKSCIDVIEQEGKYAIHGILDVESKIGQHVLGYEIIGSDYELHKFVQNDFYFLITLGQLENPRLRISLFMALNKFEAKLATIVSPLAYVSKHAQIGEGTIVMHQALINVGTSIGRNCIINTKSLVEHDAKVKDHCHISTGAIINGEVVVNEGSFVGSNSVIEQAKQIEAYSFIDTGSVCK